jgi:2-methylcitrate dehydratase
MSANTAKPSKPDHALAEIVNYAISYKIAGTEAYNAARLCLMDSLGCALHALLHPACTKLLGPVVPGTFVANGAKVPGTSFQLDPVTAAFNLSAMIRWLDFSDTASGGRENGHPSDNLGAILATADYLSRVRVAAGKKPLLVRDVLTGMIKAYELQGTLGHRNSFHSHGYDHVILVKVASAAVTTVMLGGTYDEVLSAVSNAFVDGQALRNYRQEGSMGSRKSWAGADAASRGVYLALMARRGEMGYPLALSAKKWGTYDVFLDGKPFKFEREYGTSVIENVNFKISYPTAFNCQPAVECALKLYPEVKSRISDIEKIVITTHARGITISDKRGPLRNPADRDHCFQYVVAVPLLKGSLSARDYEDSVAADPRIDALRARTICAENKQWTRDNLDPEKRAVPCALQIFFKDGSKTRNVTIEYPLGHRARRKEGIPLLEEKFEANLARRFPAHRQAAILALCRSQRKLEAMPVHDFVDLFVI